MKVGSIGGNGESWLDTAGEMLVTVFGSGFNAGFIYCMSKKHNPLRINTDRRAVDAHR